MTRLLRLVPADGRVRLECTGHGVQPSEKDYMAGWTVGDRERAIRMSGSECCAPN